MEIGLDTSDNLPLFCKDSNLDTWYSFTVFVPQIALVIANLTLYGANSSFLCQDSLGLVNC